MPQKHGAELRSKKGNRILLTSKDYDQPCFGEHFEQLLEYAKSNRCQSVMMSLNSIDDKKTISVKKISEMFAKVKTPHPRLLLLETGDFEKEFTYVDVFTRRGTKVKHDVFHRHFASTSESSDRKQMLVTDFESSKRIVNGNTGVIICGEANIVRTIRRRNKNGKSEHPIVDDLCFLKLLDKKKVKTILNSWHYYCRRPEANWKRQALSGNGRLIASVWNTWKNKIRGESKRPWVAFHDGKDVTDSIVEISNPVKQRPDIRVGVLSI
jgi:hypothetical protein